MSKKSNHNNEIKNFVVHQQLRTEYYGRISQDHEQPSSSQTNSFSTQSLKFGIMQTSLSKTIKNIFLTTVQ